MKPMHKICTHVCVYMYNIFRYEYNNKSKNIKIILKSVHASHLLEIVETLVQINNNYLNLCL